MKTYIVKTRFVFDGTFEALAENKAEASRIVENCCGLAMGGNIHTNNRKVFSFWDFPMHPEKVIVSVKSRRISKNRSNSSNHLKIRQK